MTQWSEEEIEKLSGVILEKIYEDLKPLNEKKILVLCSGEGDVAFWLIERTKDFIGEVIGLELEDKCLKRSIERKKDMKVEFHKAEKYKIPYSDNEFDALISEFIIFPTPTPTEIGQSEMARVLKKGGKLILTDVITTKKIPDHIRDEFRLLGLDYLCEATKDDFKEWITQAGLRNIEIVDLTPTIRSIWEEHSRSMEDYHYLLDSEYAIGKAIFYIYVGGEKL